MPAERSRRSPTAAVDRLIHEPARLAVMTNLFVVESANATYLLQQTGLTWGNLGSHLAKLEEAGYVVIEKGYRGKRPETTVSLTEHGRAALVAYRDRLLAALAPVSDATNSAPVVGVVAVPATT